MPATITPKRQTVKEPSIEKLAKSKARGQAHGSNGREVLGDWYDVRLRTQLGELLESPPEVLLRLLPDDRRLAGELVAKKGDLSQTDRTAAEVILARGQVAIHEASPPETHAGVPGNGKPRSETKLPKAATKAAAGGTLGPVVKLKVADLVRHPKNRKVSGESIDERSASMAERGQLEPIIVRQLQNVGFGPFEDKRRGNPTYQILSGETRWLAARKLGWTEIEARLRDCTDAEALELVAEANGQRKDLNPIERANLIEELCKTVVTGGAGLTKDAAAKRVGLKDGSSASNLVRLLKLPKIWQDRVAGGELPESFARLIVPICHAPNLLAVLDETWKREKAGKQHRFSAHWRDCGWDSRDQVQELIDQIVKTCTRPIENGKHSYRSNQFKVKGQEVWNYTGDHPRRFKLTPEVEKTLDIVELTIDDKPVRMATNVESYDKLQIPAIVEHVNKHRKGKAAKSGADGKAEKREQTPAQKKANAKKQGEQLQARIDGWRHDWLKSLIAKELEKPDFTLINRIGLLIAIREIDPSYSDFGRLEEAVCEVVGGRKGHFDFEDVLSLEPGKVGEAMRRMAIAAITTVDKDCRYSMIDHELMEGLAALAGVDVKKAWDELQDAHENLRLNGDNDLADADRFALFFELFQTAQLDELGKELGVHVGDVSAKAAKIKILLTRDRNLKLPSCIKPLAVPGKRGTKSSTAKRGK